MLQFENWSSVLKKSKPLCFRWNLPNNWGFSLFGAYSIQTLKLVVGGLGSRFPGLFACNLYTLGQDFYASDVYSNQAAVAKSSLIKIHGDVSLLLVKKWQEAAQETMISLAQDIGYRKEIRGMNLPIHDSCSTVLLKAGWLVKIHRGPSVELFQSNLLCIYLF